MLKKVGIGLLVVLIFILMLWFTSNNPGNVSIDLAFGVIEPSISEAFTVTFILGSLFGVICMSAVVFRLINERRKLRRALRHSQSEVSSLRNLPLSDAD